MCWRAQYCFLLVSLCAQARAQGQCSDPSFYRNLSGVCVPCPGANQIGGRWWCDCMANFYREDYASDCNACPYGTSTPQGNNLHMTSCSCAPGHSSHFDKTSNTLTCSICQQNTYIESTTLFYPAVGFDLVWSDCDLCPQNSFSAALGATSKDVCAGPGYCKADTYWRAQSGTCSTCPEHSSNPETPSHAQAATVCLCDAGFRSEVDGSGVQTCVACAPGSYAATNGANACVACANGTKAGAPGATACEPCAPGWHTPAPGARECLRDPVPASAAPAVANALPRTRAANITAHTTAAKAGEMSPGIVVAIVLGVAAGIALCAGLVLRIRGRQLARVSPAHAQCVPMLPVPEYHYIHVHA
jgi:hypothetical protein